MKVERVHITEIWPDLSHAESLIRRPLLATGILMIILGVIAILLPFVATLTMTLFVGILLVVAGVTHIAHSFETHGSKGWLLRLIGGILYALAGIFLLAAPARGMVTLTVVLVVLFLLVGIDKIVLSFHLRRVSQWGWQLLSGLISIAVAIMIWLGLPETAVWAIGLLVGIELIFNGVSMAAFGLAVRARRPAERTA
jgi:uncharacterized membrane protein HdeD (DUF308 family)